MSGVSFTFSEADVQAYLESPTGVPYLLTVEDDGILATNLSGTTTNTPLPYINVSGGTITGTLNAATISGTTISGSSIIVNGLDAYSQITISANSGLIDGGVLSIGSPTSTFSVTDGNGQISDYWTTPGETTVTEVSWTGLTDLTVDNLATNLITFVAINSSGSPVQQTTPFTNEQDRENIVLGVLVHVNLTNLDAVNNEQNYIVNPNNQFYDMSNGLGFFNINGNIFSANGANLNINKSIGDMWKAGSNYSTNIKNPHTKTLASLTQASFQYRFSNGDNGVTGIAIDPDNLDDGAGGLTAMTNNRWSVQRIYSFTSNNVKIQRGVAEYATKDAAIAGIPTEGYVTEPSIAANGLLRGFLVVQDGATDLSNTAQAEFLVAGKFGEETSGGGGSGGATTLQGAYDNSTTPEIVTSATNGPLTVEEGDIGGDLFDGKDALGNIVFAVGPSGSLTASGNFINKGLNYPTVDGVSGTSITTDGIGNLTFVAGGGSGEINTSSNLGTGEGLASAKVGVDLPFKTISGLSNIELTSDANTVYISGTINTTTQLPEGTNLYYTEGRVDANATVTQNTTDIATVSGVASQNTIDIVTNAGDIATVSGVASQNTIDIATNTSDIVYVSGVAASATTIAVDNASDIVTVSGVAFSAIQNGSNVGGGLDIFSAKNGTNLEFNTVSGVGNVSVTIEGNTVVFSGTGDGNGDVVGPASATDNALAIYDGTTGKLIKNSSASVSDITDNTTNIATVSGVASQNTIDITTNTGNIATVSGVAASAIQSGVSLGGQIDIFSAKNGTNLEFNTVEGVGNVSITTAGNVVTISGTGDGAGDVTAAGNIADDSIVRGDGGAKGVQDTGWTISDTDEMTVGSTSNVTSIFSDVTTNEINIAGGNALNAGSRIQLHGNGHASLSNIGRLYAGNQWPLEWSATELYFPQVSQDDAADKVLAISGTSNIMRWIDKTTIGGEVNTASNLGLGIGLADTKVGSDLPFFSVSGVGSVNTTLQNNVVMISGSTAAGTGDVTGPAGATDNAIAVYNGTTGQLIKNSSATVADITDNATNIATVSGVAAQNTTDIVTVSGIAIGKVDKTGDTMTGDLNFSSGAGLSADTNFAITMNNPSTSMVFNAIQSFQNIDFNITQGTGAFRIVEPSGVTLFSVNGASDNSTFQGNNVNFASGTDILSNASGTTDIGTAASPFRTVYADVVSSLTINANEISGASLFESGNKVLAQREIVYVIDGGGSIIPSGSKGVIQIPWDATVNSYRMLADVTGSAEVDVRRQTQANYAGEGFPASDSITGTETPTLSSAVKTEDVSITTWSGISAGDNLEFRVIADTTTITRLTLNIPITPA